MEQPRISRLFAKSSKQTLTKRSLPPADESDFEQPFTIKKLGKNFENSVGFSQTNFSNSKPFSFPKESSQLELSEREQGTQTFHLSAELRKSKLIDSAEERIERFKTLLPKHFAIKFHPSYEQLLSVASCIDNSLSKRAHLNFMQSLENIKMELRNTLSSDLDDTMLTQINFLAKDFYRLLRDPLGNRVVGLPLAFGALPMRKYRLRGQLYQYVLENAGQNMILAQISDPLPERSYEVTRTPTFFPQITKKCPEKEKAHPTVSKKFVAVLEQHVNRREVQITEAMNAESSSPSTFGIDEFVNKLEDLFKYYKVSHIYRANIINWFQRQGLSVESILTSLELIEKTGMYLRPKKIVDKSLIYQLRPSEKSVLLQKLKKNI